MAKLIRVPLLMSHPLLLPDPIWEYEEALLDINRLRPSYRYDLAYYHGLPAIKPWVYREKMIPYLVGEWKSAADEIQLFYKDRNTKAALPFMIKGLQLFTMLLFWGNKKPVELYQLVPSIEKLPVKPANIEDRLSFILKRPSLYQSYIQLAQLFIEAEKQIIKDIAITNIKSQRKL